MRLYFMLLVDRLPPMKRPFLGSTTIAAHLRCRTMAPLDNRAIIDNYWIIIIICLLLLLFWMIIMIIIYVHVWSTMAIWDMAIWDGHMAKLETVQYRLYVYCN